MDAWNPQQYNKFEKERDQPFYDLMHLIHVQPDMRVVDLGCGTGRLTRMLHDTLNAKETLGIDSSEAMLQQASAFATDAVVFQCMDITAFRPTKRYDLIFSNAALQWLPNQSDILSDLPKYLTRGGQIAIQVPSNFSAPTHTIAKALAEEAPFRDQIDSRKEPHVLSIEQYAHLLHDAGACQQHVSMQVYGHKLESTDSAIEWVKGSLLTFYRNQLSQKEYDAFLSQYTARIRTHFGDQRPLFFPFTRILLWAQFD